MLKMNQKGFALAETLIVSVFVMTIFTIIFLNFFPMMGEYERRQNYDDVDSIYKTYLFKRLFESPQANSKSTFNNITTTPYKLYILKKDNGTIDYSMCTSLMKSSGIEYCKSLINETKASRIILTKYKTKDLKNALNKNTNPADFGSHLNDYIRTLPYYIRNDNNAGNYNYRVIVMYENVINAADNDSKKSIMSFSTIGVDPK